MNQPRCVICGNLVCRHMEVNEAGIRMSNIVNNIRHAHDWDDIKNCWLAFALSDGSSSGILYDTREEVIRFHRNRASRYFYVAMRSCMHGMSAKEATLVLAMTRVQALRGRYQPENGFDPIQPLTNESLALELKNYPSIGVG